MDKWAGVVLAAGQGARMKSKLPKALHRVCGKEMVRYPVDIMRGLGIGTVVVVVSPSVCGAVRRLLGDYVEYAVQPRAAGTGDALGRAQDALEGKADHVLVMNCDAPLVQGASVNRLMGSHVHASGAVSMLTAQMPECQDLGVVLRDGEGRVLEVREASEEERNPRQPAEVNGGVYCFRTPWLWENLKRVRPSANGEKYLTNLIAMASQQEENIAGELTSPTDILGVNNRVQLAQVESAMSNRIREHWMLAGVTIRNPESVQIDADATIGPDTVLLPNTMLLGQSRIGEDCEIGPGSVVKDSTVGRGCRVTASVLEESTMEDGVDIGPFSHLRPGAYLESGVHIGNYVEVKESRFAAGAVMGHFGYVGDASVGARVNMGAGTITCNYDGKDKHRTNIGADAFIGCDTMLIAPVSVGDGAYTGAGSVVTRDVPAGRLAVGVPAKIREQGSKSD
jgi:bifunctional UDP-N-acetylglucosamine pyrophosphorylase/glucosamine-1-phosphate N-acetyltransferase